MIHNYDESIAYLERLVATPVRGEPGAGLQRSGMILAWLDNPQNRFITIHITGSSGKGSTAAMIGAMLRSAGYRTGSFSSPHLEEYVERIAVDGRSISPDDWTNQLNRLRPLIEAMADDSLPGYSLGRPALLQVLWPMAAQYFAERGVEVAVVEVGIGGRYDSTNANNACVAVITNVSLEHTQLLGDNVEAIALHKVGIAKPGGVLVTAAQTKTALDVIAGECERQGTTLWRVASAESPAEVRYGGDQVNLRVDTPVREHLHLRVALDGWYQLTNAACAVAAVDAMQMLGLGSVDEAAVRKGLIETRLAGRLEHVSDNPVTILDGAHNPDAALALAVALREKYRDPRVILVLGILGDKDAVAMVDALAPLAAAVIVTEPPWPGRIGYAAVVAQQARYHLSDVAIESDPVAAFALAQRRARALRAPLVVTGSLILVGAVRSLLTPAIQPLP